MKFDDLLAQAVTRDASDLHLKPDSKPVLRTHGGLQVQENWPTITKQFMDAMARRMLGERHYADLIAGREKDFPYVVGSSARFRVNFFLAKGEIRAVLRVIPLRIPTVEELRLPKVLEKLTLARRGMVLVTGVSGAGKSTTLAALIDSMNRYRNDHIITIEDPIEFIHEDMRCVVSQREIGHDSGSFVQALRAALREDPDVILVGEMRDAETMSVALHAAETGHLVLSTLHTLNAAETVNRIVSMFPPYQEQQIREQLAALIHGIVSQRLVVQSDAQRRVPAAEIMISTALIRDCIREPTKTSQIPAVIAAGQAQYGMQTFDQSLLALYREGTISFETAREAASNPDDFELKAKGIFSAGEMTWAGARGNRAPDEKDAFFKKS